MATYGITLETEEPVSWRSVFVKILVIYLKLDKKDDPPIYLANIPEVDDSFEYKNVSIFRSE